MEKSNISHYEDQGFCLLKDVFTLECINELTLTINELAHNPKIYKNYSKLYHFETPIQGNKKNILRCIKTPDKISTLFREIASNSLLLNHLSDLIGENIRLERMKIHFKHAFYGSAVKCHQDWAYQPYTNDHVLMLAIPIDSCTTDNAPIYVLPGSHKGPVYSHREHDVFAGFINIEQENLSLQNAVPLLANPGDALVHHYRTVHHSPANQSSKSRRMLLLRYAAADAWPLLGALDFNNGFCFKQLQDRIVLGKQTLAPRLSEVPVIMPLPYPPEWNQEPK